MPPLGGTGCLLKNKRGSISSGVVNFSFPAKTGVSQLGSVGTTLVFLNTYSMADLGTTVLGEGRPGVGSLLNGATNLPLLNDKSKYFRYLSRSSRLSQSPKVSNLHKYSVFYCFQYAQKIKNNFSSLLKKILNHVDMILFGILIYVFIK